MELRLLLLLVFGGCFSAVHAQTAPKALLFSAYDTDSSYFIVDALNPANVQTRVMELPGPDRLLSVTAAAFDNLTGELYVCFFEDDCDGSGCPRYIGRVDTATGIVTQIGGATNNFTDLAAGNGRLWGMGGEGGTNAESIVEINTTTGALTVHLAASSSVINDDGYGQWLTFDYDLGKLIHAAGNALSQIAWEAVDTISGAPSPAGLPSLTIDDDCPAGMAYQGNSRILYHSYCNDYFNLDRSPGFSASTTPQSPTLTGSPFIKATAFVGECFSITAPTDGFCPGDSLLLSATFGGSAYQWYRNGVAIPGATDSVYYAKQVGTYNCDMSLDGLCGKDSLVNGFVVTAFTEPNVSLSGETLLCGGSSLTLTGASAGGGSVQWFRNGTPLPGETGQTLVVTQSGSYNQVKTNMSGCTGTAAAPLVVVSAPQAVAGFTPSSDTVDLGVSGLVSFTNTSMSTNGYQWDFGGAGTSELMNPSFTFTDTGVFVVTLIAFDTVSFCADTVSQPITVVNTTLSRAELPGVSGLQLFPNPTAGALQVAMELDRPVALTLQLVDLNGRVLATETVQLNAGAQQAALAFPSNAANGLYLLQLDVNGARASQQVLLQR